MNSLIPVRFWIGATVIIFAIVAAANVIGQSLRFPAAPVAIEVQSTPIDSFDTRDATRVRFGALEYRGGIVMTSTHRAFGGISGLLMQPDGEHFLAVTDNGAWLRGRIAYQNARPVGLTETEIAPLLGGDGKILAEQGWFDVESLALKDGKYYVGIERVDRIVRFDIARDGLAARGTPIALPSDFTGFRFNKSLECLATVPDGAPNAGGLIAVMEDSLDGNGNLRSYVLDSDSVADRPAAGDKTVRFSVKRTNDYEVSDCAVLSSSHMLLLERKFSRAEGVAVRIRKVELAAMRNGALVDGPVLFEADMAYQIDNLEGLGIHRNAQGETILTLISDDNFSPIQRNILLQFALIAP